MSRRAERRAAGFSTLTHPTPNVKALMHFVSTWYLKHSFYFLCQEVATCLSKPMTWWRGKIRPIISTIHGIASYPWIMERDNQRRTDLQPLFCLYRHNEPSKKTMTWSRFKRFNCNTSVVPKSTIQASRGNEKWNNRFGRFNRLVTVHLRAYKCAYVMVKQWSSLLPITWGGSWSSVANCIFYVMYIPETQLANPSPSISTSNNPHEHFLLLLK